MGYLYSAFLRSKQSRSATEWHVLTGSHSFTCHHTTIVTVRRKHSPYGTNRLRRQTSDIAYYSIYRPRKDERLSWLSWLTYSGRLTHISGHPSAAGREWDSEVGWSKTNVLTTVPLCGRDLPDPSSSNSPEFFYENSPSSYTPVA